MRKRKKPQDPGESIAGASERKRLRRGPTDRGRTIRRIHPTLIIL